MDDDGDLGAKPAETVDRDDVAWFNRESMRDLAVRGRLAGTLMVGVGVVGVIAWIWLAARSQQHLQGRTFALGSVANSASASFTDRIDALTSTLGFLIYSVLVGGLGVGLSLAAGHVTVLYRRDVGGARGGRRTPRGTSPFVSDAKATMNTMTDEPKSRPLRLDEEAESASSELPAFLARPEGSPVYHGFPILDGVEVDGFRLGMITDFLSEPDNEGDAFVVAPDGSRAGLIWEAEAAEPYFEEMVPPDEGRWGVFAVGLRGPLRDVETARACLGELVPELRRRWEAWTRPRSER
jgi:hypothetical protein